MASTTNSKIINSNTATVYKAFTTPEALEQWLVPNAMKGKVHSFDLRIGGGYDMSLYYPESENGSPGKSSDKEDRYTAKFIDIIPNKRIVTLITFHTDDPALKGEMIQRVTFESQGKNTKVTFIFENIPIGIKPEDNEDGTMQSLNKLAIYVE
ncbi:hypothetical protein D3C87_127300 [compost metagenome]